MNNKIEIIRDAVDEIRTIVNAECAPISELPGIVEEYISNKTGGGGLTTTFVFSTATNPTIPNATSIDVTTGLVNDLNKDWSQSGVAPRNVTEEPEKYWMSYAIFGADGQRTTNWSTPRNLKGEDGAQGAPGENGTDGQDGRDGKDGIDGSTYEYVYFRGLTSEDKPIDIPSGEGNDQDDYKPTYTKTVTVNGNTVILKWTDKAQGVDETYKYEWRSERKKEDTTTWGDFASPILWAKYGEKGKDGDGVQYIFTTTKTSKAPSNPSPTDWETDLLYQNNETEEYIPTPEDGQVWKDDPIEVDDVNQFCWVSVRKYRNGKWGRYSDPTLWTKWTDSSGTVVSDTIVIDLDPDWAMVNEDLRVAKTDITARRGNDPVIIQDITCDEDGFRFFADKLDEDGITWRATISEMDLEANIIPVRLHIKLSETQSYTKTFTIYPTSFDNETVSADFGDDNILVPCSDGETPDTDFFTNLEIPILMRVGGKEVTVTSATPDKYSDCFELTKNGNLKIKKYPGTNQRESIKFTISDGVNSTTAYLNFTKFNTAGGTISMYTLNINANDIVCDTRSGQNVYTVYTGKQSSTDNVIKASINVYSTNGNTIIPVSELPSKYAVFYANDPQDWVEDASSTIGEYQQITDDGIKIGETIAPDKCVAFQLREWIGDGEPWNDMSETNYKIWDDEIISVDIIRDIAAYKFVLTPNKIHRNVENKIVVPENKQIKVGLSKDVAGDGDPRYTQLNVIPTGYDIYYEIDNSGDIKKIGGEPEPVSLPYSLDVSSVTNSIVFYLITNENSIDDGTVVLSETISVTSDIPGESAYVGYLTDSLGIVSCDANGEPTAGTVLSTEFKVTNGTVTKVTSNYEGLDFKVTPSGSTIIFDEFTQTLPEKTSIVLTATYLDKDGVSGTEEAVYTIVKLKVAEASTILDFSNDNVIIPCDENNDPYVTEVTTFVAMLHGDEILTLTSDDVELGEQDEEGYYKLTIPISGLTFDGAVCNKEIIFTGTGKTGSWTRMGQLILTKLKAGESGQIWDLVLTADTPKFNNDTDKFDDDYVEGWVNIWGADDWRVATSNDLANAGRYIVYKANEEGESYQPLTVGEDGKFKVYINAIDNDDEAYVDIDETNGLKIALAKLENGIYVPIQEETIKASYDGRDFGKFELMLSDSAIYQTYKDNEQVTVTPNEVKIIGVYEYDGPKRFDYTGGEIHVKHVSGLDIYYSIDHLCSEYDANHMIPVTDKDGWLTNDVIPVNLNEIKDRLDVYLIAHYDNPDIEGNATTLTIVDHKYLKVVPVTLPDDVYLYHMELDQDEVKVPIDENGNVDPEFTVSVTPYFYKNDDIQDETFSYAFGYDVLPNEGWNSIKTFVASDFSNNYSYIWFKTTSQDLYKKCKITKELNPAEINIDKIVVKRDIATNLINDTISISIKGWNYESNTWDERSGYSAQLIYKVIGESEEKSTSKTNCSCTFDLRDLGEGVCYIRVNVYDNSDNLKGFEEIGVITDGMDGSAREVIYYKSSGEVPFNPTPKNFAKSNDYQNNELPIDWNDGEYEALGGQMILDVANKWTDNYPGINDSDCQFIYVSERKRPFGIAEWGQFSDPKLYAQYTEDGAPGPQGPQGDAGKSGSTPIIYPAGDFDAEKATKGEYVGNSNQAPYVYYNVESDLKGFYIAYGTPKAAPSRSNIIKKDEEVDWVNIPTDAAKWIEMNNFSAIYSDIGVLQHALVGKWVFHGDYMFSQDGHLGNPESGSFGMAGIPGGNKTSGDECSYDLVAKYGIVFYQISGQETGPKNWPLYQHIEFGSWVPNIWFNSKTGAGRLGDGMYWDKEGNVTFTKQYLYPRYDCVVDPDTMINVDDIRNKNVVLLESENVEDLVFDQEIYLTNNALVESAAYFKLTNSTDNFVKIVLYGNIIAYGVTNDDISSLNKIIRYVLLYPKTSVTCTIQSDGKQNVMYFDQPMFQTSVSPDIGLTNVSTTNCIDIERSPMLNRCQMTSTKDGCLLEMSGCSFTKFAFNSNVDKNGYYYIVRNKAGELLYNSYYDDNVSEGIWYNCNYGSDFSFFLYSKDDSDFEGFNCNTKIMLFKNDQFGGYYNVGVNFVSDEIDKFQWKQHKTAHHLIIGQLTVPSSVTKITHCVVRPRKPASDGTSSFEPSTGYGNMLVRKVWVSSWNTSPTVTGSDINIEEFWGIDWHWKRKDGEYIPNSSNNDDDESRDVHEFKNVTNSARTINVKIDASNDGIPAPFIMRGYDVVFFGYDSNNNLVTKMRLYCYANGQGVGKVDIE